jgi:DNA modification methylase
MKTRHRLVLGDSRKLDWLPSASIQLVVCSPPYPMIAMWDEQFGRLEPEVPSALQRGDGPAAFEGMHRQLDGVWCELYRVLEPGGLACINVGDATRTMSGEFRIYPNHARILSCCTGLGFQCLPEILWRKQTNAPNKFVGSGTLPPGAYVTLEHEWILILRKGGRRRFASAEQRQRRLQSAYFWEERNSWFSDVWDFKGIRQQREGPGTLRRSASFPFELAYRLINMFSLLGDWVLDPFVGAGTTLQAAMSCGRNGVGVEIDEALLPDIEAGLQDLVPAANRRILQRLARHSAFVAERQAQGGQLRYRSSRYGFPVVSLQEREIFFPYLSALRRLSDREWEVEHAEQPSLSLRL